MLNNLTRFSSSSPIVEFGRIVPIKAPKSDSVYLGLDPVYKVELWATGSDQFLLDMARAAVRQAQVKDNEKNAFKQAERALERLKNLMFKSFEISQSGAAATVLGTRLTGRGMPEHGKSAR